MFMAAWARLKAVSRLREVAPSLVWLSTNAATLRIVPSMIVISMIAVIRAQPRSSDRRTRFVVMAR